MACNLWTMASQARAAASGAAAPEGVVATRGPGGQMMLSVEGPRAAAEAGVAAISENQRNSIGIQLEFNGSMALSHLSRGVLYPARMEHGKVVHPSPVRSILEGA